MLASFHHSEYAAATLAAGRSESVTVCLPAREAADHVREAVRRIAPLVAAGLVDQLLVIDADSTDGTAEAARAAGAEVCSESALMPGHGPVLGKGDAMWRALAAVRGDLVVFLDADVSDLGEHYVVGLLGPLLERRGTAFVKGHYRRPFTIDGVELPEGGGRVTELTAKPLLELLAPELGAFHQPLAGELAARREVLEEIPFLTSYGVEAGMLAEVHARVGIDAMAQVDLGTKRNSHQSLASLGEMARDVVEALALTLERHRRITTGSIRPAPGTSHRLVTRPPMREARPRG